MSNSIRTKRRYTKSENGKKRPNISDVAADAGVSVPSVSKVLRNAYGVSDTLRAKVEESMRRLDYRPLATARAMRGPIYKLGIVLPDIRNPFFAEVVAGIQTALAPTPYQAMLGISEAAVVTEQALVESMIDLRFDGLILVGSNEYDLELEDIGRKTPLVAIGHLGNTSTVFDTVNNNDRDGAGLAVRHLVDGGYRRIAMVSLSTDRPTILQEREEGYLQTMAGCGLEPTANLFRGSGRVEELQGEIVALLASENRPEAIFCWTDYVALEVISAATKMGLRIPQDLAVVGYDNTPACSLGQNDLTSVDQSGRLMGSQAGRMVIERVEGRNEPINFVVTPTLFDRGSSRNLQLKQVVGKAT